MVGSLSLFSPNSIPSYGAFSPSRPAVGGDAACSSFECNIHGAANRARLQAEFPGLVVMGAEAAAGPERSGVEAQRPAPPAGSPAGAGAGGGERPLASGPTLLGAQEQKDSSGKGGPKGPGGELTDEEKEQVAKLKQIDAKVRAHERAHAAVGGQYAGAPSYSYAKGPDGQQYAVGGEVSIDIGAEADPEATLRKAAQVAAAALAPADPSGADRAVAAAAAQLRVQALAQIREEKRVEAEAQEAERAEKREQAAADAPAQAGGSPPLADEPKIEIKLIGGNPAKEAEAGQAVPVGTGGPAAAPTVAAASQDGPARRASQAYLAGANDNLAAAHRRIGQLVGLIA